MAKNKKKNSTEKSSQHTSEAAIQNLNKVDSTVNQPIADNPFEFSELQLWIFTAVLAIFYYLFSFVSDGFYQQDEAAHFLSMKRFWHDPSLILGNWAKPGYKLLYILPALFGAQVVTFINAFVSALTCYFTYKVGQAYKSPYAILGFIFVALQPLWINLSFRNYSELVAACILIAAVWLYKKEKYIFTYVLCSYLLFVRQEFYPLLTLFYIYELTQKRYIGALLLGAFPIVQHLWGWSVSGDPLYLIHQVLSSNSEIGDSYPRQGFDHYFLMSITIYGSIIVTLFITYVSLLFIGKRKPEYALFLPAVLFFFMYALFNLQSFPMGPATAGNLRYLLIVGPFFSILGIRALEMYKEIPESYKVLYILIPFGILISIFMTFESNLVKFSDVRDFKPLFGFIGASFLLILRLNIKQTILSYTFLALFLCLISVKPLKRSEEDYNCQLLAEWYENYEKKEGFHPILLHHTMFYYFLERNPEDFEQKPLSINEENLKNLPIGGLILWDSHYSYRPELRKDALPISYFTERPQEYLPIYERTASDRTFGAVVFKKIK